MHAAAPAGVLFHGVRRLQRLPPTGEVSLSRLQLVPQSVPDQPAAGELGRPQDVPRVRAGSVAIHMHGLPRVQTSLGIQPLAERPRDSFPQPLQKLRNVHGLQASLLRPSVHGPGQTPLHDMRGSVPPQGLWDMPPSIGEIKISCVTMEVGIEDKGLAELVSAVHLVPHLHKLPSEQTLGGLYRSLV